MCSLVFAFPLINTLIKQEKRSVLLFFFSKEIGTVPTLMFLFISNPLPRGDSDMLDVMSTLIQITQRHT